MLYGRNTERTRISTLLAEARDHRRSAALLLRGEAGIGKSALLDDAEATLRAAGGTHVLRAVGVEAESNLAYAGLNQLLWHVRDRLGALPAAQAAALRTALDDPGAPTDHRDRFTAGLAVLTLLADLAEDRGPALCLVDDAQWLDGATAQALLFAARRLTADGVVMLFAARDTGFTGTGLPELPLERLGARDAERMLADRDVPRAARARVIRESQGNPLALREFAAAGQRTPSTPDPLPVADRVTAAFRDRIAELPDKTQAMLLIAAAEGRGHLPTLLRAARRFGADLTDLAAAERAGLVDVSGRSVAFRHPLILTAAYQGAVATQRIAVHQAIADIADDPDCRVRHRASAAMVPDEDVAKELEDAAERARNRTGYATASALYRQAAELTPDAQARAARLAAAADLTLQAGNVEEAERLSASADPLLTDPAARARLGRLHATVEFERGDPRAAVRMLVEHAAHAAPDDRTAMLRDAANYAWTSGNAPSVLRIAAASDDPYVRGLAHQVRDEHDRGLPIIADLLARPGDPVRAAQLALILGDDRAVLDLTAAEADRCRRHGLVAALPNVLQTQAHAQIMLGLHADAEASVAEAVALARDTGLDRRAGRLRAALARVAAIEGDEDRLRDLTADAPPPGGGFADSARALLDLALGRHDDALRRLDDIAAGPRRHGTHALLSAADQVEAAVRAGAPDLARPAHERFRAWARASAQPWALAVAARCEALLTDAEEPFKLAADLHERSTRPFEKARTELLYGEWLRRARRRSDARVPLRSAIETFERLRAAPWLDRARAELRATGESAAAPAAPSALDRLTPQELQVVRLAAEGTSSREIAAQLFLSPRTVEYHLYKAYPKLGISSRKELSTLLEPA
ncbi:ATP-binding protein [Actinomadura sp. WAC 06369]|uniref:ATP-binding protein n=1 Tax=Actinomadura sp. WAC 06369 TaxID=2203193 RepID=UPI000F76C76D|nr:LuxR family transcriptional regulator [Actinomadura sp. WAC 06369]RSN52136.1 helix-turn-helix transcriptional regulator [Actinomadura sp. WAC 06369]